MAFEGGNKRKYTVIAIAMMLVVAAIVGTMVHIRRSTKQIEIQTEEKTGLLIAGAAITGAAITGTAVTGAAVTGAVVTGAALTGAATVVTATTVTILCKYTDFREICKETLDRIKGGIKAPSQLVKASFSHAVERIQFVIDKSITIRQTEKDPRAIIALDQCKELLGVSIDDLKRSINKVNLFDIPKLKDNTIELRVWLSGSVTFQETCIDSFGNTTSDSGPVMVKLLDIGLKLTRNSLAMLDGIIELAGGKPPISNIFIPRIPRTQPLQPVPESTTTVELNNNRPAVPQPRSKSFIFDWRTNRNHPQPEVPQSKPTINVDVNKQISEPNDTRKTVDGEVTTNIPQPDENKKTIINVDVNKHIPQPSDNRKTVNGEVNTNIPQPSGKTKTINGEVNSNIPQPDENPKTIINVDIKKHVPQPNDKTKIVDGEVNTNIPQPSSKTKTITGEINSNIPQPDENPKTIINVDIKKHVPQTKENSKTTNIDVKKNIPQPSDESKTIDGEVKKDIPQPDNKSKTINVDWKVDQRVIPQPSPKTVNVDWKVDQRVVPQPSPKTVNVEWRVNQRVVPQPSPKTINVDWRVDQRVVPQPKPKTTVSWRKEVTIVHSHGTKPVEVTGRRMLDTPDDAQEPIMLHETNVPYPTWADTSRRSLINAEPGTLKPNAIVAQDGSGGFKTIMEAVNTAPKRSAKPFIILIKEGVYKEYVTIPRGIDNVVFLGDGPTKTKITGNKNFIDGTSTFHSATVAVNGDGFIAKGIGFENTAGPEKHQAVALRVSADMSVFHNCIMEGYQDTLYTHSYRQFYRECNISGTIDFIFGNAAAVFQDCTMIVRKPMSNQAGMVTAQGRKDQHSVGGLVFDGCTITAAPEFFDAVPVPKSFLGRPWKEFSRTIIMQSFIDKNIDPEGWAPWVGTFAQDTCYYAEFNNKGPGADTSKRAKWKGVRQLSQQEAASFAPGTYIQGDTWIKTSNVPYDAGLMSV